MGIAQAQTSVEHVIHTFGNFTKGSAPYATPIRDAAGNLYGTTYEGGAADLGVVFKLGGGAYQVIYSFKGGTDGSNPSSGVALDSAGNLYGTSYYGGTANAGLVYKLDPSGNETALYSFTGGADGANPYAGVIVDPAGNVYGTSVNGGSSGKGVAYKVNASGQETVLYSFTGGADGANPYGGVVADPAGNLYGTTYEGGQYLAGTVYELSASGQETVLHSFGNGVIGAGPRATLIRDAAGDLYGTASPVVFKVDASGRYRSLAALKPEWGSGASAAAVAVDPTGNVYGTVDGPPVGPPYGVLYKVDTAGQVTVLYWFPGASKGEGVPSLANAGVILDAAGNLYGATGNGGVSGMIYKLDTAGQLTTLHSFTGARGGTSPFAGVIMDSAGNLYGTTGIGGSANWGAVYKVDAAGNETALYNFTGGTDGGAPGGGVTLDSAGNLYGTAMWRGASKAGVIYNVDPSGQETVLYNFTGGRDGGQPMGHLALDPAGNLYGTTFGGGAGSVTGVQEGVVFKLDPTGHETVLHSFTGLSDGGQPEAGIIIDSAGNLYGTTYGGGLGPSGGVVFKVDAAGVYTVLHTFTGGDDGDAPYGSLIRDQAGNLYGTASGGGAGGGGVVFGLDDGGQFTTLYSFTGTDGWGPLSGVARDGAGNLYGTTSNGGSGGVAGCFIGCGVVYRVDPSGQETVLHSFTGGVGGNFPYAGVILDSEGNLYGTAVYGGAAGGGVLYKIILR